MKSISKDAPGFILAGGKNLAAPFSSTFSPSCINASGENFDEVVLAYTRTDSQSGVLSQAPFNNGDTRTFWVDDCESIALFAVGLMRAGQMVFNTGNQERDGECAPILMFHG